MQEIDANADDDRNDAEADEADLAFRRSHNGLLSHQSLRESLDRKTTDQLVERARKYSKSFFEFFLRKISCASGYCRWPRKEHYLRRAPRANRPQKQRLQGAAKSAKQKKEQGSFCTRFFGQSSRNCSARRKRENLTS